MIIIFLTIFSHFLGQMIKTYLMTIRATLIPKNKNHKLEKKKHTFDWLYSNYYYYYYIFLQSVMMSHMKFFDPKPFFLRRGSWLQAKNPEEFKKWPSRKKFLNFFVLKIFFDVS